MYSRAKKRLKARKLAAGGLLTALIVLMGIALRLLPTSDLFINLVMSILQLAAIHTIGVRGAVIVWLAASTLLFFGVGLPGCLGFILVGGLYPLLRSLVKGLDRRGRSTWRSSFVCAVLAALLLALLTMICLGYGVPNLVGRLTGRRLWPLAAVGLFFGLGFLYELILTLIEPELLRHLKCNHPRGAARDQETSPAPLHQDDDGGNAP